MPDSPEKHQNELTRWIDAATQDLTRTAAARLAEEFRDHYQDTYDTAITQGQTHSQAHTTAMNHLGDPNTTHIAAIPIHGDPHRLKFKAALLTIGLVCLITAFIYRNQLVEEAFMLTQDEYAFVEALKQGDFDHVKRLLDGGMKPPGLALATLFSTEYKEIRIVEIAEALLEHGADPNYNPDNSWPLEYFLINWRQTPDTYFEHRNKHRVELLELLVQHGATLGRRPGHHELTLLEAASVQHDTDIVEFLLKQGHEDSPASLIFRGDFDTFFTRVNQDPEILNRSIWPTSGATPMHVLCNVGDVEALRQAVSLGGNVQATNEFGRGMLHYAFGNFWGLERFPSPQLVSFLLEQGCSPNIQGIGGGTPLLWATSWGPEMVTKLLHAGADPNITNNSGESALHRAVYPGNVGGEYLSLEQKEAVALKLIEAGTDVNATDRFGQSPLHLAAASHYTNVVGALAENGASLEETVGPFDPESHSHNFTWLDENNRPLHLAAGDQFRHWTDRTTNDTVALLLDLGADINAPGHRGRTPIHIAAYEDKYDNVRTLLQRGADPTIPDDKGRTALHTKDPQLAELFKEFGHEAIHPDTP